MDSPTSAYEKTQPVEACEFIVLNVAVIIGHVVLQVKFIVGFLQQAQELGN